MTRARKNVAPLPTEHQVQASFFKRLALERPDVLAWAVPNAAKRSMRLAALLKAEGMRSGVPDVFVAQGGCEKGFFIEFKKPGHTPSAEGKLSASQVEMIAALRVRGYPVAVCRSANEAMTVVTQAATNPAIFQEYAK